MLTEDIEGSVIVPQRTRLAKQKTLPGQVFHAHPGLLLQRSNVRCILAEAGMAINDFEDALADFTAQNNPSGVSRALTLLAEVHRAQGTAGYPAFNLSGQGARERSSTGRS